VVAQIQQDVFVMMGGQKLWVDGIKLRLLVADCAPRFKDRNHFTVAAPFPRPAVAALWDLWPRGIWYIGGRYG
jgi:hypothetical protein